MLNSEFVVSEGTVLAAFSYAIGRKSYAVGGVVRDITDNIDELSQNGRQFMLKEIRDRRQINSLGHKNDVEQWLNLYKRLEEIESEGRLL